MGHRSLVAVEEPEGYALYRDQWGGAAPATGDDPRVVVARAVASGRRIGTGLAAAEVLDALDPREHEALIVREGRGCATYAVVWLGLVLADGVAEGGAALVPVGDVTSVRRLRGHLRAVKGRLGDAVDAGHLSGGAAVASLRATVEAHPAVPEGTVWLGPDDATGSHADPE